MRRRLLAPSLVVLALLVGGLATRAAPGAPMAETSALDSPCDQICEAFGCLPLPVPAIEIGEGSGIYFTGDACLCQWGSQLQGEGAFTAPDIPLALDPEDASLAAALVIDVPDWPEVAIEDTVCAHVALQAADPGLPIGNSGLLLTDLAAEYEAEPTMRLAGQGAVRSEEIVPETDQPLLSAQGALTMDLEEPYAVDVHGDVTLIGAASADGHLHLDPSWGATVSAVVADEGGVWQGATNAHAWREPDDAYGFTGNASLTVTLAAGDLNPENWDERLPDLPPTGMETVATALVGELAVPRIEDEAIVCHNAGYGFHAWTAFSLDPPLADWLIEPGPISVRFDVGSGGIYSTSIRTNVDLAAGDCALPAAGQSLAFEMPATELAIVAVSCGNAAPLLATAPDGTTTALDGAAHMAAGLATRPSRDGSTLYYLRQPAPGVWSIASPAEAAPGPCTLAVFCLNEAPTITITAPSTLEVPTPGSAIIRWEANDSDGDARVSLYYDIDNAGLDGRPITACLDPALGAYTWDTGEVISGTYYVYAIIDDGRNAPATSYSTGTLAVIDSEPPAQPDPPEHTLVDGLVDLTWARHPEGDVIGYTVYSGATPGTLDTAHDVRNVTHYRLPEPASQALKYIALGARDGGGHEAVSTAVRVYPPPCYIPLVWEVRAD